MKTMLVSCLLLLSTACFSQKTIDVDKVDGVPANSFYAVGGEPFVNVRFVRLVSGTPYFREEWMKGLALSDKNVGYQNRQVKLDLFDNELHYLDKDNAEMICTLPLKDITLTDTVTGNAYHFVHSSTLPGFPPAKRWYLQLAKGKASLYEAFVKTVQESRPYNASTTEQTIVTTEDFFLVVDGTLLRPKKPKELPAMLADKRPELEAFLKGEASKSGSTAERMTAVARYYNSLQ